MGAWLGRVTNDAQHVREGRAWNHPQHAATISIARKFVINILYTLFSNSHSCPTVRPNTSGNSGTSGTSVQCIKSTMLLPALCAFLMPRTRSRCLHDDCMECDPSSMASAVLSMYHACTLCIPTWHGHPVRMVSTKAF